MTISVSPAPLTGESVSVDWNTPVEQAGTATQSPDVALVYPEDYQYSEGTATFAEGVTTQTISIPVLGDNVGEGNETFDVHLFGARVVTCDAVCTGLGGSSATISDADGTYTITDDDAPSFSVNDPPVDAGGDEDADVTFTVTRTGATALATSVNYATANDTATEPGDYTAKSGTLNFPASLTTPDTQTVVVVVIDDVIDEAATERFFLNLSGATGGATISDAQGIGTIPDDDGPSASFAINDVTVTEGNSGTTNAVFTVTKTGTTAQTATVQFATADQTAVAPGDYTAQSGTLTFLPSETTKTITVAVKGETTAEQDETFLVNLTGETNATVTDPQGVGTITDDDRPTASIGDAAIDEGGELTFTITLSQEPGLGGQSATVNYATSPQPSDTAEASDYTAESGSVTFLTGQATKTVTIQTTHDTIDEIDETITVEITKPATNCCAAGYDYVIGDGQGVGTITDDDAEGDLRIDNVLVGEGDGNAVFTVTKTLSEQVVTVDFTTATGTATAGDFTHKADTLTFAANETTKTISVPITQDTIHEANEEFFVDLSNATGATIADGRGVGTIDDDDNAPTLSVNDVTVTEGNSPDTVTATFTVTKTGSTEQTVVVHYETTDATATAGSDYTATSGDLTFAPGDVTKTFPVIVRGDALDEINETYLVTLSAPISPPSNATISDPQGVGTITDDDAAPALSVNDVTVTEGDVGSVTATFTVTKTGSTQQTVGVHYATADNTATAGSDYVATSGDLTFAANETTKTFNVTINGDEVDEANETYFVNLTAPSNATISRAQGVGTITDDDATPALHDFNGDGFADAAFGVPNEDIGAAGNAGFVNVIYGASGAGLSASAGPGNQGWHLGSAEVDGSPATGDRFGAALAYGDFNSDGFDDLAIGAPGKSSGRGAVTVLYGSASGLVAAGDQLWTQDSASVEDTGETADRFGSALAAGDLNGDSFADLAIGVPGENSGAGAVNVLYGTETGLASSGDQLWTQDSAGIAGTSESGDAFGGALAAGDLDGDGKADLLVGASSEDLGSATDAGIGHVLFGTDSGLSSTDNQAWSQDSADIEDSSESGDRFGFSVAIGDVDGDGVGDAIFGVSKEDVGSAVDAGAINVIFGTNGAGLTAADDQYRDQNSTGIEGAAETGDQFGFSLTSDDFDGDGRADLAAGVPGEDLGSKVDAGAVHVFYGTATGLGSADDQLLTQDFPGIGGASEKGDLMGNAVSSGDFDGDGFADLNAGASSEDLRSTQANAGAANVIYGATGAGLTATGNQVWHQNVAGIAGAAEKGDAFGMSVA